MTANLLDRFRGDPCLRNIDRFLARSLTRTTVAVDEGELSPWVTWPSLTYTRKG